MQYLISTSAPPEMEAVREDFRRASDFTISKKVTALTALYGKRKERKTTRNKHRHHAKPPFRKKSRRAEKIP